MCTGWLVKCKTWINGWAHGGSVIPLLNVSTAGDPPIQLGGTPQDECSGTQLVCIGCQPFVNELWMGILDEACGWASWKRLTDSVHQTGFVHGLNWWMTQRWDSWMKLRNRVYRSGSLAVYKKLEAGRPGNEARVPSMNTISKLSCTCLNGFPNISSFLCGGKSQLTLKWLNHLLLPYLCDLHCVCKTWTHRWDTQTRSWICIAHKLNSRHWQDSWMRQDNRWDSWMVLQDETHLVGKTSSQ